MDNKQGNYQSQYTAAPGLTFVGADVGSANQPTTTQPGQLVTGSNRPNETFTAGLTSLNQQIGSERQGAQGRLNNTLQGAQAVGQSISSAQGAAIDAMKSRVASSQRGSDFFQQAAGMVGGYLKQQQDLRAAAELTTATEEVRAFRVEAVERTLREGGTTVARQELTNILSKYKNIPSKDLDSLLNSGYEPIQSFANQTAERLQTTLQKQKDTVAQITSDKFLIKVSNSFANVRNPNNPNGEASLLEVQGLLQEITQNPELDPLQKLTVISATWGAALKAVDQKSQAYSTLSQNLTNAQLYLNENLVINDKIRSGTLSYDQGMAELSLAGIKYGQKTTAEPIGVDAAQKQQLSFEETQNSLQELEDKRLINSVDKVELTNDVLGAHIWDAINNPALLATYKNDPQLSKTRLGKSVVDGAALYQKSLLQRGEVRSQAAAAQANLARYQGQNIEQFVREAAKQGSPANAGIMSDGDATLLGILTASKQRPLTPAELTTIKEAKQRYELAALDVIKAYKDQLNAIDQQLQPYGLNGDVNEIKTRQEKNLGKLQAAQRQLAGAEKGSRQTLSYYNPKGGNGNNAPFEQPLIGAQGQAVKPANFTTATYRGKPVLLPFPKGAQVHVFDNFKQDRGTHTHAGIDIAIPEGTKILSPVNGKVHKIANDPTGYGKYITVKGNDGMFYRYAHLNGTSAHVGQNVGVGTTIGVSGNTGRSTGAHLHLEIRKTDGYGIDGTVDPLAYLQQNASRTNNNFKPRGNTSHQYNSNPSVASQQYFTKDSYVVPGGYITRGKYHKWDNNVDNSAQMPFNSKLPIRNGYMSDSPKDYGKNDPNANYGYASLAGDKAFSKAIASTATAVGVPAVWLADVMGSESTHSSTVINAHGCVGLIQFCPGSTQGYTATQIAKMSPAQQTLGPVLSYLKANKPPGGYRSPAEFHLAIFGGGGAVDILRRNKNYNPSDGYVDRVAYMRERLGTAQGRRYRS